MWNTILEITFHLQQEMLNLFIMAEKSIKVQKYLLCKILNIQKLVSFKSNIKLWKPENCACRLCKSYLANKFI